MKRGREREREGERERWIMERERGGWRETDRDVKVIREKGEETGKTGGKQAGVTDCNTSHNRLVL